MLKRTGPDPHLHPPQQAVWAWKATQTAVFMSSHRHTQISLTTGGDDSGMSSCSEHATISLTHSRNSGENLHTTILFSSYWVICFIWKIEGQFSFCTSLNLLQSNQLFVAFLQSDEVWLLLTHFSTLLLLNHRFQQSVPAHLAFFMWLRNLLCVRVTCD